MALPATERPDPRSETLDRWPMPAVLSALLEGQLAAVASVAPALPQLAAVVDAALPRLRAGGRIAYAGAGTSGRIAFQDGAELTPTFDWPRDRLAFFMAGGETALTRAVEGAEDDTESAARMVGEAEIGSDDVLFALAASGTTPFTRACVAATRAAGALTVGIACDPAAPLLAEAEFAIVAVTGPETPAGSTRMKAGTAQKVVLNLISTALMVGLGRTWRGRMVDMQATNAKLRRRAVRMVCELADCTAEVAEAALAQTGGRVKPALLVVLAGLDGTAAQSRLQTVGGDLRAALAG
ncbi:N-acetylmuramic acid 6-phosphate etherase [Endobacter medicaginis]|uniref:N-acetylmuramic acid 6-phosphate etherase n=1 Tax=Endobacter medicaginis TaxID=1181271 RepID=A0A839UU03_9PROT|nr:N-acetylmuramic acid 6-phosphate etherase [Endobacter medicaginis]MBB3173277.1 N-acetylmuramic acid 6-phosphate etherase [Endobacter medicaginis]MCX5477168.1 N-acetylmuramic acid 6-phosphate etherase [Endobacter medicaginis]NVN29937.1 N-acetylmuramic acid 6-phosphate etherase [Endobacter medicaginis]